MKLHLKNFGLHVQKTFEFPEKGTVLLSGVSGKGKTTIFRAIHFVLTGESKMVTHGETKSAVTLEYFHEGKLIKITRTNRPVRVVLEKDGKMYEDEEAQGEINRIFPSFTIAGYIFQKGLNSFLGMTPMEKLRFLEEIIFTGLNLDEQKERIKAMISSAEQSFLLKKGEYESLQKNFPAVPQNKWDAELLSKQTVEIPQQLKQLAERVETTRLSLERCTRQQEEKKRLERELAGIHIQEVPQQLQNYESLIEEWKKYHQYQSDLKTIADLEQYCSQVNAGLSSTREKLAQLAFRPEFKADLEKEALLLNNQLTQKKRYDDYLLAKQKYQPEREKELLKMKEERETFLTSYRLGREIRKCPSCTKPLRWHQNHLYLAETINYSVEEETKLTQELEGWKKELSILSRDNSNFIRSYSNPIDDPNISSDQIEQFRNRLSELSQLINLEKQREQNFQLLSAQEKAFLEAQKNQVHFEAQIIEKKSKLLVVNEPSLSFQEVQRLQQAYLTNEKTRDKILVENRVREERRLKLIQELNAVQNNVSLEGRETVPSGLENVPSGLETLRNQLASLQEEQRKTQQRQLQLYTEISEYNTYIRDCQKYNSEVERLTQIGVQYAAAERYFTKTKQFRDLFLSAEMTTLSSCIDELNYLLQNYLNIFFEQPLTIEISLFKVNEKSKTVRNQVNLIIGYQGHAIDLNSLSGGEQDRVNLAFTLALADLFNLPLVMFDETLSSLDAQSAENVIEHLPKDRLTLLIAHQVTEGSFDIVMKV